MRDPTIKNIPASIRQKLLNLARQRNDDFGLILTKYGLERILFRLSKSKYREVFVLKGALLFELWTKERYRPTRDAAERIKEDADYEGVRVTFTAFLEKAQIPIQIDIGFGDAITPGPVETNYPALLDLSSPHLLAYPRETVVSEKLEATVKLGIANTRMKDFHDLHSLTNTFEFDGKTLTEAVRATFKRRGTELPPDGVPLAFTSEFYEDENKVRQWNAFCNKNKPYVQQTEFRNVVGRLASFLVPVLRSVQQGQAWDSIWKPVRAWQPVPHQ